MYTCKRDINGGFTRPSKVPKLQLNDERGDDELHAEEQSGVVGLKTLETASSIITSEQDTINSNSYEPEVTPVTNYQRHASSKALNITEIVENVLSFLSGRDLIMAINVNKMLCNCAINSPVIQQKLYMRLSSGPAAQCYRVSRTRSFREDEEHDYAAAMGVIEDPWKVSWMALSPTAGLKHDEGDLCQFSRSYPAVRVCPWLQLSSTSRPTRDEVTFVARNRSKEDRAIFAASPLIAEGFPDIYLTSPPVSYARACLCFRHTLDTTIALHTSAIVTQQCGLTLNGLLKDVWLAKGDIWLEGPFKCWSHKPISTGLTLVDDDTLAALSKKLICQMGGSFILDFKNFYVHFDAVILADAEWDKMCEMLAEDKARNEAMSDEEYTAWISDLLTDAGSESLIQELLRIREDAW